jgi:hypothetical protein
VTVDQIANALPLAHLEHSNRIMDRKEGSASRLFPRTNDGEGKKHANEKRGHAGHCDIDPHVTSPRPDREGGDRDDKLTHDYGPGDDLTACDAHPGCAKAIHKANNSTNNPCSCTPRVWLLHAHGASAKIRLISLRSSE